MHVTPLLWIKIEGFAISRDELFMSGVFWGFGRGKIRMNHRGQRSEKRERRRNNLGFVSSSVALWLCGFKLPRSGDAIAPSPMWDWWRDAFEEGAVGGTSGRGGWPGSERLRVMRY